jgi:hypothetical protein
VGSASVVGLASCGQSFRGEEPERFQQPIAALAAGVELD